LGYSPQLIDTVFSLEVLEDGENSPVIEVEEGRAVVVHVTGYRESEVKPLEAVSEEITAQLQTDESILLAAKDGNELLAGLNDGGDAAELLAARGLEWQRQDKLGRGAAELPADLAAEIFRVSGPEEGNSGEYRSLMLASGDFAVYRITRVSPGQPGQFSLEDRNQRKEQLAGRLGGGQASAVVEALVESAAVTIVPDLLGTENDLL